MIDDDDGFYLGGWEDIHTRAHTEVLAKIDRVQIQVNSGVEPNIRGSPANDCESPPYGDMLAFSGVTRETWPTTCRAYAPDFSASHLRV